MVELTSLDIKFITKELQVLIGGRIQKIYQTNKTFLFEIYTTNNYWLHINGSSIFLAEKRTAQKEPPSFCMFLRKHLLGQRVRAISQHGFDRVIEIVTDRNILIAELFGGGNVILCDSGYRIIMPLQIQRWTDRTIKPGAIYRWPSGPLNPFELSISELQAYAVSSTKSIGAWLAVDLGFGPIYSREICFRADIDPAIPANQIDLTKILSIIRAFEFKPCLYPHMVSSIVLKSDSRQYTSTSSLSQAINQLANLEQIEAKEKLESEIVKKVEAIVTQQEMAKQKWQKKEEQNRNIAQTIYSHWSEIEQIVNDIKAQRKDGKSWEEIKTNLKPPIKELDEKRAIITFEIEGQKIDIDIRKSLSANVAKYFTAAKRARSKWQGVVAAQAEYEQKIKELKEKAKKVKEIKKVRKKWYERFRWFISSDGFLIVAGKSAAQNEELIKKRVGPEDLVCHADIHGAAFVVIKAEKGKIGERAKKEGAQFAACFSKAWSAGLGTVDVFCVRPEQLSKEPGLPKGAFAVSGQRMWFKEMEVRLTIGIVLDRKAGTALAIAGPVMAVKARTNYFVTIQPGQKQATELAKEIKRQILAKAMPEDKYLIEKVDINDIVQFIPSGTGDIVTI